jgi:formylglycine-generating enzyme required for sulfatase activity
LRASPGWELAARGGRDGAAYVWGDAPEADDVELANFWPGEFPRAPAPGYGTTTTVGAYPANG